MKKLSFRLMLLLMGVLAISIMTSCSDDDNDEPQKPKGLKNSILIQTTVKNPDGRSGSSFMQLISKLEGDVDNSKAIQMGFISPISVLDNEIYNFPTFGKDGEQILKKYTYTVTELSGPVTLDITPNSFPNNVVKVNDSKIYMPTYNEGKVWIINPKTMQKTGEIDLTPYAHTDNSAEPSYGIIRDGLYYLPLDQVGSDYMPYMDYLQTDVAIIDTKTDKVLKVISEKESGLCFPTRPMLKGMVFTTEKKDIYIACAGYFGYNPAYLKSGFVCIPAGKQAFDASKSWDVSNTKIEGTDWKPSSVVNSQYIGNGKLVAFVAVMELATNNPYTSKNGLAVLVDLNAKTIKKIEGIPTTDGHSVALEYHKGIVYLGAYGEKRAGVFSYNPNTGETKHLLSTAGNPAFFHFFE